VQRPKSSKQRLKQMSVATSKQTRNDRSPFGQMRDAPESSHASPKKSANARKLKHAVRASSFSKGPSPLADTTDSQQGSHHEPDTNHLRLAQKMHRENSRAGLPSRRIRLGAPLRERQQRLGNRTSKEPYMKFESKVQNSKLGC